jgi:beta-1,4-N-acetylglucosaminyltransferase
MKIALVSNLGGHLTQMLFLLEAFENHEIFFVTNKDPRIEHMEYKKFIIEYINVSILKMIKAFIITFKILLNEKPDYIISTGAEIAIPFVILGKILGINTIYIESWSRVKNPSKTGRILYYIADIFLVQWPDLVKKYGKKARYEGGVV